MSRLNKWFVMLRDNDGSPIPLAQDDDIISVYDSYEEAENAAEHSSLGLTYGFEIYPWNKEG
jgi:hypothetical protein